jgi:hypothetical protein
MCWLTQKGFHLADNCSIMSAPFSDSLTLTEKGLRKTTSQVTVKEEK